MFQSLIFSTAVTTISAPIHPLDEPMTLMMSVVPSLAAALAGCVLIGLGLANVVPVLFSAAANVPGKDAAQGISAVASIGYLGFMVGPSVIGFVAQHQSLPVAMGLMVVCAAVLAVAAPRGLKG